MNKSAKGLAQKSAEPQRSANPFFSASGSATSFFQPKLKVGATNDHHEREADQIAERVMSTPSPIPGASSKPFFTPTANQQVQRQDEDESSEVLSEGASIAYEQLKLQPGFEGWKKQQTEALKYKLWDSQPTELKAGVIGFGLSNVGMLGTAFALDPRFRSDTIDFLQDKNLLLPLSLLPYSEYFPVSSFKYKLPTAEYAPYTFKTEFGFDEWFKLAQEKWDLPKVSLGVGIESSHSETSGFKPVTGGSIKLKLGGGIVNLSGFYNQTLPPTPMLISDPGRGEPPMWLMRSLPAQLDANLPKGHGVFLTVDVLRLPELFNPNLRQPESAIQRKENGSGGEDAPYASQAVHEEVNSVRGQPLEANTKQMMESRFGQDFSHVRLHTDNKASESAESINAKAYTSSNHIVFGAGQYQPGTRAGLILLAHELVHVGQQTGTVQRKEAPGPANIVEELREKLNEGGYISAYLKLNDHVDWDDEDKKKWLQNHPEIRFLFLKNLRGDAIADVYSAEQLKLKLPKVSFRIIDCWYQSEREKQALYADFMPLFDYLLGHISPYTGVDIFLTITNLINRIKARKKYQGYGDNPEFHTIHLLAPTVERKIKFYDKYKKTDLFKAAKKKFDPFTGISKETMEILTDTNEVDREKAQEIYRTLKELKPEQLDTFLETAAFAGNLETDKDAQKFYKKKYKKHYKALPHNWDFAFFPWNWGEAPFADRMTIDHVLLMSSALYYEDLERRKFGFDRGINDKTEKSITDPTGSGKHDVARLLDNLRNNEVFYDHRRLAILLAIAVRGGIENDVSKIVRDKNSSKELSGKILTVVENYGFVASDNFNYHPDQDKFAKYNTSRTWYVIEQTLFGGSSGKVVGEQRGTFDLRKLQVSSDQKGSLGGMRFGTTVYKSDTYYNEEWLAAAVKADPAAATLLPNLEETRGGDRSGKIFASIRNDIRQANIFASTLPIEGLNFFSAGTLYRSGRGVIQGLALKLKWEKDTSEPDNSIDLRIDIGNLFLNQLEMVAPVSTLVIGQIGVKGFRIKLAQNNLAAAEGLWLGLLKNADFMLNSLIGLLPNVLKLLPYAVMSMTEEFKGYRAHQYKDALGDVLKNDFSALDASVTFTSLKVRDLYDTAAGFLDDVTIEKEKKSGGMVRQGIRIKENMFWTTDALFNLKRRIRSIDVKIRAMKAEIAESDLADKITALEIEKEQLMDIAVEKGVKREPRHTEFARMLEITSELRVLNRELDKQFEQAKKDNPLYDSMPFRVLWAERAQLQTDLEYIDKQYFADKKVVEDSGNAVKRFEARKRMEAFEAKYKSVDVRVGLRGIKLHGGEYVRDLINEIVTSAGFTDPQFEGIENINVPAVDASFTTSSVGVSATGEDTGASIRGLHLPLLKDKALAFKSDNLLIEAGKPVLENIYLSAAVKFAKNPLDKDRLKLPPYVLENLYVTKATFNGLTVKVGDADPLLDFPEAVPVQVWGLRMWDYDSEVGNINLKITDVKAQGTYASKDEEKETEQTVEFGIDTTVEREPGTSKVPALDLRYNKQENSITTITTRVNIASAWLPSLDVRSPTLDVVSHENTEAVRLTNVEADVKVIFGKEKTKDKPEPTIVEINSLHIKKLEAQGLTITKREAEPEAGEAGTTAKKAKTIQVVTLPKKDKVSIDNLDIKGLRLSLAEESAALSAIEESASIHLGKSDLGGIQYKEKTARGSVLKSISIHRGKFNALNLDALNRNDRQYTLKEFFKFFGRTTLEGADIKGTYEAGKTRGTIDVKGKKNIPISIEYVETEEGKWDLYKIRLPLQRVKVPELHFEKDAHVIDIPRAKSRATTSVLNDVDVKLRAYLIIPDEGKVKYDVYLDSLQVALFKVYGLEYHNADKGIDVVFDAQKPLFIPNVKAGGFRFSSWKAFDVFGKEGGWLKAAAEEDENISAYLDSITAELENGNFLAEKDEDSGRSALDIDIASLGFKYDKDGNISVELGAISGGFPKFTITQKDPTTGAVTTTEVNAANNKAVQAEKVMVTVGADTNTIIDATGLKAGEITITSTEKLASETSTTKVKLGPEALGAESTEVKLNADKSKEITIKDIRGGKIDIDLVTTGKKGKSENFITLPDAEAIVIQALKINVDSENRKRITVVKPTIKNVTLRHPNQKVKGDYTKVSCDIVVDGNIELGDGDFATLTFAEPYDAFVGFIEESVPIEFKNIKLEIQDSVKQPETKKPTDTPEEKADREKLRELRKEKERLYDELQKIPPSTGHGRGTRYNPIHSEAMDKYLAAKKLYDDQRAKMVSAASAEVEASITPDQRKLIKLEKARDTARSKMLRTPSTIISGHDAVDNPEWNAVADEFVAARKAYEDHKAKMIADAKAEAQASMTKKYLDALSGKIKGSIKIFGTEIPVNIESYQGEEYIQLDQKVIDAIKAVIRSLVKTTIRWPFWRSEQMKAIGEGLKRWWLRVITAPTAKADVDNIAKGNAYRVVQLLLRDIDMWAGKLDTDSSLYGINLNIEGYWALDVTSFDSIGIGLCELQYRHPTKKDFYSLYGIIEYLQYVSPTLVSASGQVDQQRLEELAQGIQKTSAVVGEMGIAEAVNELVLFIKSNLAREAEHLKNTVLNNIEGVNVTADVSLRPQEVINALVTEYKAGKLTFDKGKETIDDVHIEAEYTNKGTPQATIGVGGGAKGEDNITIPGATYLSQDKAAKVSYDSLEITPVDFSYKQDVYKLETSAAKVNGLKFGLRKK